MLLHMKQRLTLFTICLLMAQLLCATDDPSLDLYAGWRWMPFSDSILAPYHDRGSPYWRSWSPTAGIGVPLMGHAFPYPSPYGYSGYGYAPYGWGLDYGVYVRLDNRPLFALPDNSHSTPIPGSAPIKLRDPDQEEIWSRAFEILLDGQGLEAWGVPPDTSAPSLTPDPTVGTPPRGVR